MSKSVRGSLLSINAAEFLLHSEGPFPILNRHSFLQPLRLDGPASWAGHIPFAFFIISLSKPRTVVELGTHFGMSYFAFCQIIDRLGLPTQSYAVDTWRGDEHSGFYGEDIFSDVAGYNFKLYSRFSRIIRSTFDEALPHFEDKTIDLLHIDGLHTYDAVKHDFESWLPKLSNRSIVLFHDTNVRERGFAVNRLWSELSLKYPSFEFWHSHGLGILGTGADLSKEVSAFFDAVEDNTVAEDVRMAYASLGSAIIARAELSVVGKPRQKQKIASIKRIKKRLHRLFKA